MRAVKEHRDPRILYEVKDILHAEQRQPGSKSLADIQNALLKEEDAIFDVRAAGKRSSASTAKKTPFKGDQHTDQRQKGKFRRTKANAVGTSQNVNRKQIDLMKVQCYGCRQFGHYLRDCKTTPENDKQRLYELERGRYQATNSKAATASKKSQFNKESDKNSKTRKTTTKTVIFNDSKNTKMAKAKQGRDQLFKSAKLTFVFHVMDS